MRLPRKSKLALFVFAARFPNSNPVAITLNTQKERISKAKRPDQITIAEFINGTPGYEGWLKERYQDFLRRNKVIISATNQNLDNTALRQDDICQFDRA